MICVVSTSELDVDLVPGMVVGEVHPAMVQTRVCQSCSCQDKDSWIADETMPKCKDCGVTKVAGPSSCRQCGAGPADCCVLSHAGCESCRPEAKMKDKVRRGSAAGFLAKSALAFTMLMTQQCVNLPQGTQQSGATSQEPSADADAVLHPVFHIIQGQQTSYTRVALFSFSVFWAH